MYRTVDPSPEPHEDQEHVVIGRIDFFWRRGEPEKCSGTTYLMFFVHADDDGSQLKHIPFKVRFHSPIEDKVATRLS